MSIKFLFYSTPLLSFSKLLLFFRICWNTTNIIIKIHGSESPSSKKERIANIFSRKSGAFHTIIGCLSQFFIDWHETLASLKNLDSRFRKNVWLLAARSNCSLYSTKKFMDKLARWNFSTIKKNWIDQLFLEFFYFLCPIFFFFRSMVDLLPEICNRLI